MKTMKRLLAGAVLAIWIAASGHAQTYTFRNVAGNAASTYGGSTDGANGNAQFSFPAGAATDSQGNVYVADQFNCTIRKVTPAGTNWVVSTIAGSAGVFDLQDGANSYAFFNFPAGIAVDPSGNLFVADTGNNAIRKVTPLAGTTNWVVTTIAGMADYGFADGTNSTARFNGPAGIAVDANGNVFVADQYNNSIRKITPVAGTTNWSVTTIAGQGPDTNGVADGTNTAAQFSSPTGVAADTNGHLFVADQANNEIRKMTSLGTNWIVTTIAGHNSVKAGSAGFVDGTNTAAQFNGPAGVAVDTSDNIYVADQTNNAIRKLTPLGANWVTTTIGGQPHGAGTNNGAGTNALFNSPFGLAVDAKGGVFVADTENNTIRIGFLPPAILTAAPPLGFSQGQFGFNLTGPTGQLVLVEASSNLLAWLPIWTNAFGPGPLSFTGPQGAAPSPRFYRVHLP